MTIEEVIEALQNMLKWGDPYEVNCEACREAIRYLKQDREISDRIERGPLYYYNDGTGDRMGG